VLSYGYNTENEDADYQSGDEIHNDIGWRGSGLDCREH
jgi:hypothetical protein